MTNDVIPHFYGMPGIGDNGWMFQKLQGQFSTFDFTISDFGPRRSDEYLKLLGCRNIYWSKQYDPTALYKLALSPTVDLNSLDYTRPQPVSINGHLEEGRRVEEWHPEYPTKYQLDFATTDEHRKWKDALLCECNGGKIITVYTSSVDNNSANRFFSPLNWVNFIKSARDLYGNDTTFVITGAEYDMDCTNKVISMLKIEKIKYVDAVGYHIGVTIEILKASNACISYPSGIGITASFLGIPCIMWMFPWIRKMHYTWIQDEVREKGEFLQLCISEKRRSLDMLKKLRIK